VKIEEENRSVEHVMNNYLSIGFDAKIALQFHRAREAHPSRFTSRSINKVACSCV
jgi:diacylglycerol kinase (ATP)